MQSSSWIDFIWRLQREGVISPVDPRTLQAVEALLNAGSHQTSEEIAVALASLLARDPRQWNQVHHRVHLFTADPRIVARIPPPLQDSSSRPEVVRGAASTVKSGAAGDGLSKRIGQLAEQPGNVPGTSVVFVLAAFILAGSALSLLLLRGADYAYVRAATVTGSRPDEGEDVAQPQPAKATERPPEKPLAPIEEPDSGPEAPKLATIPPDQGKTPLVEERLLPEVIGPISAAPRTSAGNDALAEDREESPAALNAVPRGDLEQEKGMPAVAPPAEDPESSSDLRPSAIFLFALVIVSASLVAIGLSWIFTPSGQRRLAMKIHGQESVGTKGPSVIYNVPRFPPFSIMAMDAAATLLARLPMVGQSQDLDVDATIQATIHSGGHTTPVRASTRALHELTILVDIERGDHPFLNGVEWVLARWAASGLRFVRLNFQHHPTVLTTVPERRRTSFDALGRRTEGSPLIIFARATQVCRHEGGLAALRQLAPWPV